MPGTAGSDDKTHNHAGAPTPVTAAASDAPSNPATAESPTPHPKPRSAMASEPVEYDDFGLPIKKYVAPAPAETPSDTDEPAATGSESRKTASPSVRKSSIGAKGTPDAAASRDSSASRPQASKKDDDDDN